MHTIECSLQSNRLFGDHFPKWRRLEEEDWRWIHLPDHLRDQVFRIVFARTPAAHLFEMIVSEQCPRDAYSHMANGIAKLVKRSVAINVIHGRSPNAHLILWQEKNPKKHYHLDIDFTHLSRLDLEVISCLNLGQPPQIKRVVPPLTRAEPGRFVFQNA